MKGRTAADQADLRRRKKKTKEKRALSCGGMSRER